MSYSSKAYWEIFYPFVVAIMFGATYFFVPKSPNLNFTGLVEASLNLFGILIGFLITVLTILNTIENSYTRALKNGESYHLLSLYLKHSIWGCFISIVTAIIHIFFICSLTNDMILYANTIFLVSFLFALTSSYRFILIFLKLTLKKVN